MLIELHIEDLGLIERLDLVFGQGLTVFTGETGAGKTMLVEAINLLVGERADPSRVRVGASEARVEGRFVLEREELVIARVVPVEGRSRAYVNGRLATVGQLAEIGATLVDVHGQHSHQSLLSTAVQRAALDAFAGTDLEPLRAARGELTAIEADLAVMGGDTRTRMREIDLLRFQAEEIEGAAIADIDEDRRLEGEEDRLADADAHREAATRSLMALVEDGGAAEAVANAIGELAHRAPFGEVRQRLSGIGADLADVAREIRSIGESCDDDPERLEWIRKRRQFLRDLQRKYGDDLGQVLGYLDEIRRRLDELESFEERVAALESRRRAVAETAALAATDVAANRRRAAPELALAISRHLPELALDKAVIDVEVSGEDPADEVRLLFTANPGMPLAPLAKVASGGELSRTMLAIRLVLSQGPPILVFDEVDAGIGGAAANALAGSLARLGRTHQVLVVTHLAQVAAAADHQVVVEKSVVERGTTSITTARARAVTGKERTDEIARMLSGFPDSETARRHAEELLKSRPIAPSDRSIT